ncbi:MAG: cytochrome c-type biogenesis protein CcmH [Acidimicrobiales bacterium]
MSQPKKNRWRSWIWAVLGVVLIIALVIGAGAGGHAPSTPSERAAALDADLRCPSCDDLSVTNSSAPTAVAIRQLVLVDTEHGISDAAIVSYLQSRYPGILLRPPASGVESIVWFAPLAGFVLAAVVVGVLFWRKRSVTADAPAGEDDRRIVSEALGARSTSVATEVVR